MKMEVLTVQQQYQTQFSGLGSNKYRDWTSTLTPPLSAIVNMNITTATSTSSTTTSPTATAITTVNNNNNKMATTNITPYNLHHHHNHHHHNYNLNHHNHRQTATINKMKNSINNKKTNRQNAAIETASIASSTTSASTVINNDIVANQKQRSTNNASSASATTTTNSNNFLYCDNNDIDGNAVNELSLRLLDELRAAKSRHLTCTEVSLPCDLTPSIAAEIIRVSEKEPCGIRGCTIYIEFEDEPNNSRRIATLKLDSETVSTFEVYLTLRQDHRGWASLLPQFMKSLARTITISPEFTITKHKLYSPQQRLSYTTTTTTTIGVTGTTQSSAAISTPSS